MSLEKNLENFPTSEAAVRMLNSVSDGFYDKSYVGKWLYQVMGLEMDEVREIFEELPYQAFPETATWGLMYHEMKYELPIRNDLSYEERRKPIIIKRDTRTPMNPWQMEQIIKTMTGFEVFINDDLDVPNTFEVTLYNGSDTLDFLKVRDKLQELKQSHVFLLRINQTSESVITPSYGIAYYVSKTICQTIG